MASTIKWIVDDGSRVAKGDKIVELDDSGQQEQLKTMDVFVPQYFSHEARPVYLKSPPDAGP